MRKGASIFLPGLCLSRRDHVDLPGQSLSCPCFQVHLLTIVYAVLSGRPPCGKSFLQSCPAIVPSGFPAFLNRLPQVSKRPCLTGIKDNRIGPCPLAPIRVHIGTCIHTHFIDDTYTCTPHKCKCKDGQSQSRSWYSPSLWGSHGDCVAIITEQGAAKGLGMFLFKC